MKAPHSITYNVAGHTFRIGYDGTTADESILPSLKKFQTEDTAGADLLFELSIVGATVGEGECHEIGQFDCGGCNHGVYRTDEGGYLFCISDASGHLCCRMEASQDFGTCHVALYGTEYTQLNYGLNNAVMMAYAFSSADKQTLLMHASVIRCDGKGYLMTAPSGTGKSTHTRLWYDNIPGCDLMNDDNPVVRIVDGSPIVYGSPWSGKTPCYRNVQAPIGGIVRIKQQPYNSIRRLSPLESLSHLLPAMSSMKWDRRIYGATCDSISGLIEKCDIFELGCLPNAEAAHLCHDTLTGSKG